MVIPAYYIQSMIIAVTMVMIFSTTKKCSMCQTWQFACKFNSTLFTMTHHIDTALGESGCGECHDVFMQR